MTYMPNHKIDWTLVDQLRHFANDTFGTDVTRQQALNIAVASGALNKDGTPTEQAIKDGFFKKALQPEDTKIYIKKENGITPGTDYTDMLNVTADFYINMAEQIPVSDSKGMIHDLQIFKRRLKSVPLAGYDANDWKYRILMSYTLYHGLQHQIRKPDTAMLKRHFQRACSDYIKYVGDQDKALDTISTLIKIVKEVK